MYAKTEKYIILIFIIHALWKVCLNSDSQQFHRYQQNKQ